MNKRKEFPDLETVRSLMEYDPEMGSFTWRHRARSYFSSDQTAKTWNTRFAGKPALNIQHHAGYLYGEVLGSVYSAHRMAWFITHGEVADEIDHINGDRRDNRLANLRNVSRIENCKNTAIGKRKTASGVFGVTWDPVNKKWHVRVGAKHVGRYSDFNAAVEARNNASSELNYHPNHGRKSALLQEK